MNDSRSKIDFIDGLRAIAALWVVLAHAWLQAWPVGYHRFPTGWVWLATGWMLYARFAVDIFLVISGFCLTLAIARTGKPFQLKESVVSFLRRRAIRILPAYYAACLLSLFLIFTVIGQDTGTHWDISVPVTKWGVVAHFLLLHDVFAAWVGAEINHSHWSIAVEWHLYFVFPLVILLWRKIGPGLATLFSIVIAYSIHFILLPTAFVGITAYYLALLALGMYGAYLNFAYDNSEQSIIAKLPALEIATVLFAITGILTAAWGWEVASQRFAVLDLMIAVPTVFLILAIYRPKHRIASLIRKGLESPWLVRVGVMSYSLYLIHAPLLQLIWQYLIIPFRLGSLRSFLLLLVIGLPLILVISFGFFYLFERPFLKARPAPRSREQR